MAISLLGASWRNTDLFMGLTPYVANRGVASRVLRLDYLTEEPVGEALVVSTTILNGVEEKIDGHSRSLAWKENEEIKPERVFVVQYGITCEEDKAVLYKQFTSREQGETNPEQLDHLFKLHKFLPKSKLGLSSWTTAFTRLGCDNVVVGVKTYVNSLIWLDSLGVNKELVKYWNTGTKVAFLDALEDSPKLAKVFITLYKDKNRSIPEVADLLEAEESKLNGKKGTDYEQAISAFARRKFRSYRNSNRANKED